MTMSSKGEVRARKVMQLGMELDQWSFESCVAHFGTGEDWATLYDIQSKERRKGHATTLLTHAKKYYESKGMKFASTISLHPDMTSIIDQLGIYEYK